MPRDPGDVLSEVDDRLYDHNYSDDDLHIVATMWPAATSALPLAEPATIDDYDSTDMVSAANVNRFAAAFRAQPFVASVILEVAQRENIDPNILFNVIRVESQFNPNATGKAQDTGLMQILPSTARMIRPGLTQAQLYDPVVNVTLGAKHLKYLIRLFRGHLFLALTAYNRGENKVKKLLAHHQNPDNGYARKIMGPSASLTNPNPYRWDVSTVLAVRG